MLYAFLVSALVAITASCFVLMIQALSAQSRGSLVHRHREVAELAKQMGGVLTPAQLARSMSISDAEADRLLRSMVDDEYFKMKVDDRRAELVFWFTELVEEPNAQKPRSRSRNSQAERDRATTRSSSA